MMENQLVESSTLELKAVRVQSHPTNEQHFLLPPAEDLLEDILAFSNSASGGIMLIGIEDDGRITGVPTHLIKEYVESMTSQLAWLQSHNVACVLNTHSINDQQIISLDIAPSRQLVPDKGSKYWQRFGASKRQMDAHAISIEQDMRSQFAVVAHDILSRVVAVPYEKALDLGKIKEMCG